MARPASIALASLLALLGQSYGQEVYVPRETHGGPTVMVPSQKETPVKETARAQAPKPEPAQLAKAQPVKEPSVSIQTAKEPAQVAAPPLKAQAAKTAPAIQTMKAQPLKVAMVKTQPTVTASVTEPAAGPVSGSAETVFTKLADGFDFPVGKPDAQGYYKARGFRCKGHLGEDWDGVGGGDTDLGDPVYSIGDGIVVFARDCHMGWGNVMIVRHAYRENGEVKYIDALYGHLNTMLARRGRLVSRGQQIATIGTAHGLYEAHLHLEIRRNIEIGMSRAKFTRDFSNYYDPSQFILAHRHLQAGKDKYRIVMNTFIYDSKINWATKRNYSGHHGSSGESAIALKKALAAQSH